MYYVFKLTFPLIIVGLGIFMTAMPLKATKKELREEPGQAKKTRRNGVIVIITGLAMFAISLFSTLLVL
ncbi:hypothetical protein B5F40_03415 [Gordonibacter sp. An230]|uniref:hypothetical protein n=1 Tax=Gordonibacter sp. An230 TaxID=1965592 RepID=UPI000B37FCBC|nr:hypothetical protein [Gordonibacter sp. An230]OUO91495.1 hypothetical protein B5F40_03415 [Gordonibacter sp. An230]